MIEILMLLLVAAAYALGRARDERDRLLLVLRERLADHHRDAEHWQPVAAQLKAEQLVWRQTFALERAAHQAMHDVVASFAEPERPGGTSRTAPAARRERASAPVMQPAGLSAVDVQRTTERTPR